MRSLSVRQKRRFEAKGTHLERHGIDTRADDHKRITGPILAFRLRLPAVNPTSILSIHNPLTTAHFKNRRPPLAPRSGSAIPGLKTYTS
jgi:hypothetical protein